MTLNVIPTYCSDADVQNALSMQGWTALLDDNEDGLVSAVEDQRMDDALLRGSTRCVEYLYGHYDPAQLSTSNEVHQYATDIASYFLATSVGRPAPDSVIDRYHEALEYLERYKTGDMVLPGIPQRGPALGWSNQRPIVAYQFKVLRTVKSTSQPQSTTQRQFVDLQDQSTIDFP